MIIFVGKIYFGQIWNDIFWHYNKPSEINDFDYLI